MASVLSYLRGKKVWTHLEEFITLSKIQSYHHKYTVKDSPNPSISGNRHIWAPDLAVSLWMTVRLTFVLMASSVGPQCGRSCLRDEISSEDSHELSELSVGQPGKPMPSSKGTNGRWSLDFQHLLQSPPHSEKQAKTSSPLQSWEKVIQGNTKAKVSLDSQSHCTKFHDPLPAEMREAVLGQANS